VRPDAAFEVAVLALASIVTGAASVAAAFRGEPGTFWIGSAVGACSLFFGWAAVRTFRKGRRNRPRRERGFEAVTFKGEDGDSCGLGGSYHSPTPPRP